MKAEQLIGSPPRILEALRAERLTDTTLPRNPKTDLPDP